MRGSNLCSMLITDPHVSDRTRRTLEGCFAYSCIVILADRACSGSRGCGSVRCRLALRTLWPCEARKNPTQMKADVRRTRKWSSAVHRPWATRIRNRPQACSVNERTADRTPRQIIQPVAICVHQRASAFKTFLCDAADRVGAGSVDGTCDAPDAQIVSSSAIKPTACRRDIGFSAGVELIVREQTKTADLTQCLLAHEV
jgi:hypothetical protein